MEWVRGEVLRIEPDSAVVVYFTDYGHEYITDIRYQHQLAV